MSEDVQGMPPAGWYPDAAEPAAHRWWDGASWTHHVHRPEPSALVAQLAAVQPAAVAVAERELTSLELARIAGGYEPQSDYGHARTGTWRADPGPIVRGSAQSFSGWLFAFSPLWAGGTGVFVGFFLPMLDVRVAQVAAALITLLLTFGLAVTDGKRLRAAGYKSTSPGWVLVPLVYFILRTVRTGARGLAMLVTHVLLLLAIVAAVLALYSVVLSELRSPPYEQPAPPQPASTEVQAFDI